MSAYFRERRGNNFFPRDSAVFELSTPSIFWPTCLRVSSFNINPSPHPTSKIVLGERGSIKEISDLLKFFIKNLCKGFLL